MSKKIDKNFTKTGINFNGMINVFADLLLPDEIYKKNLDLDLKKLKKWFFY
jgi:hypothetical protein